MRNLSELITRGSRSFAKAKASGLRVRRRRSEGHLALSVGRYVVRLGMEGQKALGECVDRSGRPCIGFARTGKCYHVARALLFVAAKT